MDLIQVCWRKSWSRKDHLPLEEQLIFLLKYFLYSKVLSHREFCVSITPLVCVFDFISLCLISLSGFGKLLTLHLTQQLWKQFWILRMSHCIERQRMKRNKCGEKRSCKMWKGRQIYQYTCSNPGASPGIVLRGLQGQRSVECAVSRLYLTT